MAKPSGSHKTIEGFASEHEANAWIVQAQRMIRAANPWTPLAPRKTTGMRVPPAASLTQSEQKRLQDERNRAAKRRANARAAHERTNVKS